MNAARLKALVNASTAVAAALRIMADAGFMLTDDQKGEVDLLLEASERYLELASDHEHK